LYAELESTPWGNELIQALALAALKAEGLGSDERTDILAVSYSSNDYVGHRYGPDSPETRDMALRVDVLIGDLLRAAEAQAGPSRVLTVLTADHGVAPLPEANARRMPGGRFSAQQARSALEKALAARFGQGKWVADVTEGAVYFDAGALAARGVDRGEMERVAAEALREQPHVFRVYTRTQLMLGAVPDDQIGARVRNGFHQGRSGDVIVVQDPYWLGFPSGTTHGSPFSYDAHVPVIFLGPRVRAGRYDFRVAVSDIAPTLATLLEVETPSGSVGRPLHEILK
jgi:arylsulfatase A-like enzyme